MSAYKLPKKFTSDFLSPNKKPVGNVEIDWSNPLTKGLIHYFKIDGNYGRDLVLGSNNSSIENTPPTISPKSITTSGANDSIVNLPVNIGSFDGFSLIVGGRRVSGSVALSILDTGSSTWTGFYLEGIENGRTSESNSFDGVINPVPGGAPLEDGNSYAAYSLGDGGLRGALNGGGVAQDSSVTIPTSTPNQIALGGSKRSTIDNESVSEFLYVGIYNRALSDRELIELSSTPYKILKPSMGAVYFTVGADNAIEVTPSAINSLSVSNNPSIAFASALNIQPNTINSLSTSLDPLIEFKSVVEVQPQVINSLSAALSPAIEFSSVLNIAPQTINSTSISLDPTIDFSSVLNISPDTINSASVSIDPLIEFKSVINLFPTTINSLSAARNPIISTGQEQTIGEVTASFKDSGISVKYDNDIVSVGYKPNSITVNFK